MCSRHLFRALLIACFALVAARTAAQTGEGRSDELSTHGFPGAERPLVIGASRGGASERSSTGLKEAEIAGIVDYLAAQPVGAPAWATSRSPMAAALKGRLQVLRDEKLVDFDPGTRPEPEFYLVYFGAAWSEPCLEVSPKLVSEYQRLKRRAADRFEMIFVSQDRSSRDQLKHVRQVAMPWPVFRFSQLERAEMITRWVGLGIPCLVVVTRAGQAILESYRRYDYVAPREILGRFESLLQALEAPAPGEGRRALHALAVLQHVRAVGSGNATVVPYVVSVDPDRYRTLKLKEIVAMLDVDEQGAVQEASFEPALPPVLQQRLTSDAARWLFLPAVENGQAVRKWVQLPLQFGFK